MIDHFKVDKQEFYFQFNSHPDFPSALAYSDTLNFMGISNDVYNLEKEYWAELPNEFITIYKNNFALIEKQNYFYKVYTNKIEYVSLEQLQIDSNNLVFLFEKTEEGQEKKQFQFSYLLYVFVGTSFLYSIMLQKWEFVVFNMFSILGLYISIEIYNRKIGKESVILNNLCRSAQKDTSSKNCTKIIETDKINALGLKLSDLSLVYFSTLLILGVFYPYTDGVLKIISFSSVLIIGYSLFVQTFEEKAFCKICLLIILVLIGQIIVTFLFFNSDFFLGTTILSATTFVTLFFGLAFINDLIIQKEKYRKSDIKNLKFKRNYNIFKRELREKQIVIKNHNSLFLIGNPISKLKITLITNPYCGFCKDAHIILENLLTKYPNISAQICFSYFPDSADNELTSIISVFKNIYEKDGGKALLQAIEYWYEKKDIKYFEQKYKAYLVSTDLTEVIELASEIKDNEITFTPAMLINGYQFPKIYEVKDIFYFIDDLIADEELIDEKF